MMKQKLLMWGTILLLSCSASLLPSAAHAGAKDGPMKHDDTIQARKIDVYHITFNGQEQAIVKAKAHADDIDLYVYDSHGNLIDKDVSKDDTPVCIWTPAHTDTFTIKIVNNENHDVDYTVETN